MANTNEEKVLIDPMAFDTEEDLATKEQKWKDIFLRHPDLSNKILEIYDKLEDENMKIFHQFVSTKFDDFYKAFEEFFGGKDEVAKISKKTIESWNAIIENYPGVAARVLHLYEHLGNFNDLADTLDTVYSLIQGQKQKGGIPPLEFHLPDENEEDPMPYNTGDYGMNMSKQEEFESQSSFGNDDY